MKYTYIIANHNEKGLASPEENITASFKNPVSVGDLVFWVDAAGRVNRSCCGRVIDIEHMPDFSVLRIEPK